MKKQNYHVHKIAFLGFVPGFYFLLKSMQSRSGRKKRQKVRVKGNTKGKKQNQKQKQKVKKKKKTQRQDKGLKEVDKDGSPFQEVGTR